MPNIAQQIDELAGKLERPLAVAFREGFTQVQNQISLKQLRRLLTENRIEDAINLVSDALIAAGFFRFSESIELAYKQGGMLAAGASRVEVRFNIANPSTARFLDQYQFGLIQQIGRKARDTVRSVVSREVLAGTGPLETARLIRSTLGLTTSQEAAVNNFETLLRNRKLDALSRALRDKRFDPTIARLFRNGKDLTEDQIQNMVMRYRDRYIAFRARTVARTESIRAVSAGSHQLWQQAIEEGKVSRDRVKRFWIHTQDGKTRHSHIEIPRMNEEGVGVDQPFQSPDGPIMFPGDPGATASNTINCRCAVFTRVEG